jgi:hypothetical protein
MTPIPDQPDAGSAGPDSGPRGDLFVYGYDGLLWKYAGVLSSANR